MLKSGTYGIKIKIVRNLFREDRDRRKATVSFMARAAFLVQETTHGVIPACSSPLHTFPCELYCPEL